MEKMLAIIFEVVVAIRGIRGMNKMSLEKRIQILSMLCEGFVHAGDFADMRRVHQHGLEATEQGLETTG